MSRPMVCQQSSDLSVCNNRRSAARHLRHPCRRAMVIGMFAGSSLQSDTQQDGFNIRVEKVSNFRINS